MKRQGKKGVTDQPREEATVDESNGKKEAKPETPVSSETENLSKSEQRRRAIMQEKVRIKATVNTTLPDGTYVPEGETVEVSKEYAGRLLSENDKSFIIIN